MLHAKTRQVNIRGDAGPARSIKLYAVYAGEPLKPSIDNYYWTGLSNYWRVICQWRAHQLFADAEG